MTKNKSDESDKDTVIIIDTPPPDNVLGLMAVLNGLEQISSSHKEQPHQPQTQHQLDSPLDVELDALEILSDEDVWPELEGAEVDGEPEWQPRKPYRRTLRQWVNYFYYTYLKWRKIKPQTYCTGYDCPLCWTNTDDNWPSDTLLEMGPQEYDYAMSYEFGGTQTTWYEKHQCEHCGTVFDFQNGSC